MNARVMTTTMTVIRFSFLLVVLGASVAMAAGGEIYDVDYRVKFLPADGEAAVTMTLRNREGAARRFDFRMDPERYGAVDGDGKIERRGKRLVWTPPDDGGVLRWRYRIDRRRRGDGYDARITDDWVIVRGDQLFPAARVRMTRGAESRTRLRFELPRGWSNLETPWTLDDDGETFLVTKPRTRFDRPTGWIIAGDVGTRREHIGGVEVVVGAPKGHGVRRLDLLALIHWTLPEMRRAFGELPEKILIVGAGDPMWRGGLSGPRSVFLHADRPLIGEDGTSTALHELTHAITRIGGRAGHKYIPEGIAELYAVELLHRSGATTEARYERTIEHMKRRSGGVKRLRGVRVRGDVRARAVLLFRELDEEIRRLTDGEKDFGDLVRLLMKKGRVDTDDLIEAATEVAGRMPKTLDTRLLRPQ